MVLQVAQIKENHDNARDTRHGGFRACNKQKRPGRQAPQALRQALYGFEALRRGVQMGGGLGRGREMGWVVEGR